MLSGATTNLWDLRGKQLPELLSISSKPTCPYSQVSISQIQLKLKPLYYPLFSLLHHLGGLLVRLTEFTTLFDMTAFKCWIWQQFDGEGPPPHFQPKQFCFSLFLYNILESGQWCAV